MEIKIDVNMDMAKQWIKKFESSKLGRQIHYVFIHNECHDFKNSAKHFFMGRI